MNGAPDKKFNEMREALKWFAEMAEYTIHHLDDEWARKNRGDLQDALDQANAVLAD